MWCMFVGDEEATPFKPPGVVGKRSCLANIKVGTNEVAPCDHRIARRKYASRMLGMMIHGPRTIIYLKIKVWYMLKS